MRVRLSAPLKMSLSLIHIKLSKIKTTMYLIVPHFI